MPRGDPDDIPIMLVVDGDWADTLWVALPLGALFFVSRNLPVFALAKTRKLPGFWLALVPLAETFVLMVCVGAPRRLMLILIAIAAALFVGLGGMLLWFGGDWRISTSIWLTPDIVLFFVWRAACDDAGISRGWAVLAAWPYIGGLGGRHIVRAVADRISLTAVVAQA